METEILGKNIVISEEVEGYIRKKTAKTSRHFPQIISAKVEVYEEKTKSPDQRFTVKVILQAKKVLFTAEERAQDIYTAVDITAEALARQIEKHKGKMQESKKGVSANRQEVPTAEEIPEIKEPQETQKVVKVKKFPVKPMSVPEAAEQMEVLGHSFFIFINADSGDINLLYRRKDGDYGLIQPDLA